MERALALALVPALALVLLVWWLGDEGAGDPVGPASPAAEPTAPAPSGAPAEAVVPDEVPRAPHSRAAVAAPEAVEEPEPRTATPAAGLAAFLTGRCVGPAGGALEGVRISGPGIAEDARSAPDGTFRLRVGLGTLLRRSVEVTFARDDLAARRVPADLLLGATRDLGDVVLVPGAVLRGVVRAETGEPLADARVRIEETAGGPPASPFEGPGRWLVEGVTAADGTFEVASIPPGEVRAWAGAEGWRWGGSERLDLRPGETRGGVLLELFRLRADETIELQVVDPAGEPVPNALLSYRYQSSGFAGSGTSHTDEHGRHRLFVEVPATYSFLAQDPEHRYRPALAKDVAPGTRGLVLRLGERAVIELRCRDAAGEPVPRFDARAALVAGDFSTTRAAERGRVELPVLPEEFRVHVAAEGYEGVELGPYGPASAPRELDVELRRLPGVQGTVLGADGPLAGAEVSLHRAIPDSERYTVHDFPCFVERWGEVQGETDAEGRYALTLRAAGEWFVRASAPGHAPGWVGPLTLDPYVGARDVDVALGRGGAIEGRVRVAPSEDPAGLVVGFSCGDGYPFTRRTDADGAFRADGLTPGPWQVSWRREEIVSGSTTSSRGGAAPPPIEWTCEVQEGRTTRVELDVAGLRVATLVGRVLLGGRAPERWSASLVATAGAAVEPVEQPVGAAGDFVLPLAATGPARLTLSGPLGPGLVHAELDLDLPGGETPLELELPAGELRLALEPGLLGEGARLAAHSTARPGLELLVMIPTDRGAELVFERFPAGPARLVWSTPLGEGGAVEIEVPAGGRLARSVP